MKKITTLLLLISFSFSSFSQDDTVHVMTKQDYLTKSRGQKIAGFVLLGIGATCFAIAAPGNVDFEALGVLVVGGGIAALSSIPLFIAAGRNKRKARRMTASFQMEPLQMVQQNHFAFRYYPAVGVRFRM